MTTTSPIPSGIRGVSDRDRMLPRLGKLRLGKQVLNKAALDKKNPGRADYHPEMTDYFVSDDDPNGRRFRELYGDAPKEIAIAFVSDDPGEFARHALELYGGGGLRCRGNGEIADALVNLPVLTAWQKGKGEPPRNLWASSGQANAKEVERRRIPCLGMGYDGEPACPMFGDVHEGGGGCTPTMHLQFILPNFPGLGVWQLDTGSRVNIDRVLSFVELLKGATGGRVAWIPLLLRLVPMQMRGRTFHVLQLSFDGTLNDARLIGAQSGAERVAALLPAPSAPGESVAAPPEDAAPDDFEPTAQADEPCETEPGDTVGDYSAPPAEEPPPPDEAPTAPDDPDRPLGAAVRAEARGEALVVGTLEWRVANDDTFRPAAIAALRRFGTDLKSPDTLAAFWAVFGDIPAVARGRAEGDRMEITPNRFTEAQLRQAAEVLGRFAIGGSQSLMDADRAVPATVEA